MGRRTGGTYITPVKSDGTVPTAAGAGKFTLALGQTYYFPLGGPDAPIISAHLSWDASIIITSITLEDSNLPEGEASNYDATAGLWIDEDPPTAFVGVVGAGVTASNGVTAATGGAAGGAMYHVSDTGALRSRLKVVVGATGGVFRCAAHGKE